MQLRVDRGGDLVAALLDALLGQLGPEDVLDVVDVIPLALQAECVALLESQPGLLGLGGLSGRDEALFHHLVEHEVAPFARIVRVAKRVVVGRRLRQSGEQRGLRQRELGGVLAEVRLRCGLDPDGVVAVKDAVEVALHDRRLGVLLLEVTRQIRLGQLDRNAAGLVGVTQVLHQLHRDGRAALPTAARAAHVFDRGTGDAFVVDPPVHKELLVLDRDGRVDQEPGHVVVPDRIAVVLRGDGRQQLAVAIVDAGVLSERDRVAFVRAQ